MEKSTCTLWIHVSTMQNLPRICEFPRRFNFPRSRIPNVYVCVVPNFSHFFDGFSQRSRKNWKLLAKFCYPICRANMSEGLNSWKSCSCGDSVNVLMIFQYDVDECKTICENSCILIWKLGQGQGIPLQRWLELGCIKPFGGDGIKGLNEKPRVKWETADVILSHTLQLDAPGKLRAKQRWASSTNTIWRSHFINLTMTNGNGRMPSMCIGATTPWISGGDISVGWSKIFTSTRKISFGSHWNIVYHCLRIILRIRMILGWWSCGSNT